MNVIPLFTEIVWHLVFNARYAEQTNAVPPNSTTLSLILALLTYARLRHFTDRGEGLYVLALALGPHSSTVSSLVLDHELGNSSWIVLARQRSDTRVARTAITVAIEGV